MLWMLLRALGIANERRQHKVVSRRPVDRATGFEKFLPTEGRHIHSPAFDRVARFDKSENVTSPP